MNSKLALTMLFRSAPRILDEEVGIYDFKVTDDHHFELNLYFITSEGFISIRLMYKGITIYEASTEYDAEIKIEQDNFKVFREKETTPVVQVMVIPNVVPFSTQFNLLTQSKQKILKSKKDKFLLKYNDFDLTVLFCNYPKVLDKDAQIFEYSIDDGRGFGLSLYLAVCDRYARLQLTFEDKLVYQVELDQIVRIHAEKDYLKIFREFDDGDSAIKVMVVPNFTPDSSLFTLAVGL